VRQRQPPPARLRADGLCLASSALLAFLEAAASNVKQEPDRAAYVALRRQSGDVATLKLSARLDVAGHRETAQFSHAHVSQIHYFPAVFRIHIWRSDTNLGANSSVSLLEFLIGRHGRPLVR
jgi:hypothetical protein